MLAFLITLDTALQSVPNTASTNVASSEHGQHTACDTAVLPPQRDIEQSPVDFESALNNFKSKGNAHGALQLFKRLHFQKGNNKEVLTADAYIDLITIVRKSSPLDLDIAGQIAYWFYVPVKESPVSESVLRNEEVWKNLLKMALSFAHTYRHSDMCGILNTYLSIFDHKFVRDMETLGVLFRVSADLLFPLWSQLLIIRKLFGLAGKYSQIDKSLKNLRNSGQFTDDEIYSLTQAALLGYAYDKRTLKINALLEELKSNGRQPSQDTLNQLIRAFAVHGDIPKTEEYTKIYEQCFGKSPDLSYLLVAHKNALFNEYKKRVDTLGLHGKPLNIAGSSKLQELHASWKRVTDDLLQSQDSTLDIKKCNIILNYMVIANHVDPALVPIREVEHFVRDYMPSRGITPDTKTYELLVKAFARCQEPLPSGRLDRVLDVFREMQSHGHRHLSRETYHALLKACIPHKDNKYPFDYFRFGSLVQLGGYHRRSRHTRLPLDPRLFDIENIILSTGLRHDRQTMRLMFTCFGAAGRYEEVWKRWRLLKISGLKRDASLYQHVFALASLDPQQAKYALSVITSDMTNELSSDELDWPLYVSLLDCCAAAQDSKLAGTLMEIIERETARRAAYEPLRANGSVLRWPSMSEPEYYAPMLRTTVLIKGMEDQAEQLLKRARSQGIQFNSEMWQSAITLAVTRRTPDRGEIQRIFTEYTMQRLHQSGKIPIPVRDSSPAVPFPSAPYTTLDYQLMDTYIASLVDAQDLSLVMDVVKTLMSQTSTPRLSRTTAHSISHLAKQENSKEDLEWLVHNFFPYIAQQNSAYRRWIAHMKSSIQ